MRSYYIFKHRRVPMKRFIYIISIVIIYLNLTISSSFASPYYSPSKRYIEHLPKWQQDELHNILEYSSSEDMNLFNNLINNEKPGVFGYHAQPYESAIYQDIIKIIITEILNIEVQDDFVFLRVPGQERFNYTSSKQFLEEYNVYQQAVLSTANKINKLSPKSDLNSSNESEITDFKQALDLVHSISNNKLLNGHSNSKSVLNKELVKDLKYIADYEYDIHTKLLAMNFALYQMESGFLPLTIESYLWSFSWCYDTDKLSRELEPLFKKLGMDETKVREAFNIAEHYIPQDRGYILRVSQKNNNSSQVYNKLDQYGYVSYAFGMPFSNQAPSYYYSNNSITNFKELKLLMSNYYSLNPISGLTITKHSTNNQEQYDLYYQKLKEYILSLQYDAEKADDYKKELIKLWVQQG